MAIDAGAHISRAAGLSMFVASLGCGPEIDHEPELHQPRVCDQTGPVDLIEFEGQRGWASVRVLEDRWLLLAGGAGAERGFESHTVDPCGGASVRLPENAWPLVIGGQLFGCDVNDGSLRSLDPRTGEQGEVIERGLLCDSVAGGPEFALLRRVDSGELVSVAADGQVRPTGISMASTAAPSDFPYLESLTSFLYADVGPDWDRTLVLDDDNALWHVDRDQSTRVSQDVAAFVVAGDVVVLQRLGDAEAERFHTSLVSLIDGTQREGPEVDMLYASGGYLFTPDGLFEPRTGVTHPAPEGVGALQGGVWPESGLAYSLGNGLRVWEIETGRVLVDDSERRPAGLVQRWDDAIVSSSESPAGAPELWSFPLDGSDPERVYLGTDPWMTLLGPNEVLSSSALEGPADIIHHDLGTGEERLIVREAVSNVVQHYTTLLDEPVLEGGRPGFYITEREGGAVLTMTVFPERT